MYKKIQRFCKICAEEIKCRNKLYCKTCNITRRRKPVIISICEKCGESYKAKSHAVKYCSQYCRKIVYNEKQKLRLREKGKGYSLGKIKGWCKFCKKEFSLTVPHHMFCNAECRGSYYEKIQKNTIIDYGILPESLRLRFEILKRDNFTCRYCGRNVKEDKVKLEIDHIIPRSRGGKDIPSNLQVSCFECNQGKKDVILENRKLSKLNVLKIEVRNE